MNITFDLSPLIDEVDGSKTIPIPYLQAKGYEKKHIVLVFSQLDEMEYGVFYKGKCGRYNVGIFYPNNECPISYDLEIKDKVFKKDIYDF